MGITFKENCPDIRNSKVADLVKELQHWGASVVVTDPWAIPEEVMYEYGSGDGMCLLAKRLDEGRFVWPQATGGSVHLSPAQLSMLLEGINWHAPKRTRTPTQV